MSATSREVYSSGINGLVSTAPRRAPDRRQRVRLKLRWPLLLYREPLGVVLRAETEDISSSGIYFRSPTPFVCGEAFTANLMIPTHDPVGSQRKWVLECRLRIARAEAIAERGGFGIGCHIEEFHLLVGERDTSTELASVPHK